MFYLFLGLAIASGLLALALAVYVIGGLARGAGSTWFNLVVLSVVIGGFAVLSFFLFNTAQTYTF